MSTNTRIQQSRLLTLVLMAFFGTVVFCHADDDSVRAFEAEMQALQETLKVPGFSMALTRNGKVLLSKGYGWADIERKRPAKSNTPYPLASLTKTFTATLLLQAEREHRLSLDDEAEQYIPDYQGSGVQVKHLASHTSEGNPGNAYKYNHGRFAQLAQVLQKATGRSYPQLVEERILSPLKMKSTVLGADPVDWIRSQRDDFNPKKAQHYMGLLDKMATSYKLDANQNPVPYNSNLGGISAAGGIISTVEDLTKYYVALDGDKLLPRGMAEKMYTRFQTPDGRDLPYGLGWFVYTASGTEIAWHYGYIPGLCSSLVIKVPSEKLNLIVLANSDGFSTFDGLIDGQLMSSPVAARFIEYFLQEQP